MVGDDHLGPGPQVRHEAVVERFGALCTRRRDKIEAVENAVDADVIFRYQPVSDMDDRPPSTNVITVSIENPCRVSANLAPTPASSSTLRRGLDSISVPSAISLGNEAPCGST